MKYSWRRVNGHTFYIRKVRPSSLRGGFTPPPTMALRCDVGVIYYVHTENNLPEFCAVICYWKDDIR
jgi:hypothetical protein